MLTSGVRAKQASVVIADDHITHRTGFKMFIEQFSQRLKVIGEAADGYEAYKLCKELKPDILILDLHFNNGGPQGETVISKLRSEGNETLIFVLTGDEFVQPSHILKLGADACMDKGAQIDGIIRAIEDLSHKRHHNIFEHSARLPLNSKNELNTHISSFDDPEKRLGRLTRRELQVLTEVAKGYSSNTIANNLSIDTRTVGSHLRSVYEKLGVKGRSEAIVFAFENKASLDTLLANI